MTVSLKVPDERVRMELTRTVTVTGTDDKPALELKAIGDEVSLSMLPRNGSRRAPVRLADLLVAVDVLKR